MDGTKDQVDKGHAQSAVGGVDLILGKRGGRAASFFPQLCAPPLRSRVLAGLEQLDAFLLSEDLGAMSPAERVKALARLIVAQHEEGNEDAVIAGLDVFWRSGRGRKSYLRLVRTLLGKPASSALWHVLQHARTEAEKVNEDVGSRIRRRLVRQRPNTLDGRIAMVLPQMVDTWSDALEKVRYDHFEGEEEDLRWFYDAYDGPALSFEHYVQRARWGRAVRDLTSCLAWVHHHRRQEGPYGLLSMKLPLRRLALDMWEHVDPYTVLDKEAYARVGDHRQHGRSVVITVTHAGFMNVLRTYTTIDSMPITIVGAGHETSGAGVEGNFSVLSVRRNAARSFLELIRTSRTDPQVVGIAADGLFGGEAVERTLLGRKIWLRTGAADLAYAMQGALFHAGGRLVDGRLKLSLVEGPSVEPGMEKDAWREQYFDFFIARLEEIARGLPEGIHGPFGPKWNIFTGPDGKPRDEVG